MVAVDTRDENSPWDITDSLAELASLARTAGAQVVGQSTQRLAKPDPRTYVGKGRALEIVKSCADVDASLVIVDDELSPNQQRRLEDLLEMDVIDRTTLILDIFALHAHTREGQLQVELAQYEYMLPRLLGLRRHLSRQAGGAVGGGSIGVRGPGETKLEVDRRRVRDRITQLHQDLAEVREQRERQRQQRGSQAMPVVAIVGYTNAGKSTLFNTLTQSNVRAEDQLFATLDPTTRHVVLPSHQEILLTDTVGFIQKLPTTLVASFRATLEEVQEADILLEVVDISHDNAFEQSETVFDVLAELGAGEKPRVSALNKVDRLAEPGNIDLSLYPSAVPVSATMGAGIPALLQKIGDVLASQMTQIRVEIPFARGDLVELFHRRGLVENEDFTAFGTVIAGKLPPALISFFKKFAAQESTPRQDFKIR